MFVIDNTPADMSIDTFSGEKVDVTIDVVADIRVEVLAAVKVIVSVGTITALSFAMSSP